MASFRFNFSLDGNEDCSKRQEGQQATVENTCVHSESQASFLTVNEITSIFTRSAAITEEETAVAKGFTLLVAKSADSPLSAGDAQQSDLVPGVYEGGLKVWECSLDLVRFLDEEKIDFSNKHVLELGCGVGLPGVLAAIRGASKVMFQDYNKDVLISSTIPTLLRNTPCSWKLEEKEKLLVEQCSYIHGDWLDVKTTLSKSFSDLRHSFDIILTSETIYNESNYLGLLELMKFCLNPSQDSTIYLVAKICYFGVGGSIQSFIDFVKNDKYFDINNKTVLGKHTVHKCLLVLKVRK